MTNLYGILSRTDELADCSALSQDDITLTYGDLRARAAEIASWAGENGIKPGDRVVVLLPNVLAFPIHYYGLLSHGAVVVPLNPLLKDREITHVLEDSGAKAVVLWHGCTEALTAAQRLAITTRVVEGEFGTEPHGATSPIVERDDDDTAVILYTSGTTGSPKGAELTHANLRRNAEICATSLFSLTPDDTILGALPLFHTFGQTAVMNAGMFAGAHVRLLPRFTPEKALEALSVGGVTVFAGVPTMYVALNSQAVQTPPQTPQLRLCLSGGASLPEAVLRDFEAAYGCAILEGYGLSETSPAVSFNRAENRKVGSVGLPIDGVEMRIVDPRDQDVSLGDIGEIVVRGHNVMKGYWANSEATTEAIRDGWFHTGDLARMDEDGFYFIVDRSKDLIIRGGYNVYPREIEEVLYEHPDVVEAAVIGIPDDALGEEVGAAVVTWAGSSASTDEIRDWVKSRVAPYKYPRHVWITHELPKGPTGKILKRHVSPPQR